MRSIFGLTLCSIAFSLTIENLKSINDDVFLGEPFETGYAKMEPRGHMFFWHIPSRKSANNAPLVMWLSGGPGCGSDLAVVGINGPWWVDEDTVTLRKNEHSWTNHANMLYVDQPLGSGFSTAELNYKISAEGVSKDLRSFLEKFLEIRPEYKNRPFFIAGESYAGKYVPNIGEFILDNPIDGLNFQGIAVGNGWVDPPSQYPAYAKFGHEEGLISSTMYPFLKKSFSMCGEAMKTPFWPVSLPVCNAMTMGVLNGRSPYHIKRKCKDPPQCLDADVETLFFNRADVRARLGVLGSVGEWKACSQIVHLALLGDYAKSSLPSIEAILASKKLVLFYYGDQDWICNWRGGDRWLNELSEQKFWEKKGEEKKIWRHKSILPSLPFIKWGKSEAGDERAGGGAIKVGVNFVFARLFGAGHMAPHDVPKVAEEMISSFLSGNLHKQPEFAEILDFSEDEEAADIFTNYSEEEKEDIESDVVEQDPPEKNNDSVLRI
eukprot:GDKJ01031033.1.p1 GENE.GDKJ01031033.1~~GDKJ01031033.1.p1  ORF type:complete len:492 (-),score=73.35 GDKJ01031033.1:126-1601(-)